MESFRSRLKRELPLWRQEGLIDDRAASILRERYRLDEDATPAATIAIYLIGSLLIGGGIISFVAWNWEAMSRVARLALLGAALLAAHTLGYRLWRGTRWPKLGHAIVFLGSLIFGANIALVSQMYHLEHDATLAMGAWALGALVPAWTLLSVPNGVLAAIAAIPWLGHQAETHPQAFPWQPYLLLAVLLPLAWKERSRLLFLIVAAGFGVVALVVTQSASHNGALFFLLPAAMLACVGIGRIEMWHLPATLLGLHGFVVAAYVCAFRELGEEAAFREAPPWRWYAITIPLLLFAAAGLWLGRARWRESPLTFTALAGSALILLSLFHRDLATIAANVALAALSLASILVSMRDLRRGAFWFGNLLAYALLAARFIEYETSLGLKALVFTSCGIAVILFGMRFERRRKEAHA